MNQTDSNLAQLTPTKHSRHAPQTDSNLAQLTPTKHSRHAPKAIVLATVGGASAGGGLAVNSIGRAHIWHPLSKPVAIATVGGASPAGGVALKIAVSPSRGTMLKVVGASWEQTRVSTYILAAFTILGLFMIIFSGHVVRYESDGNYAATVTYNPSSGYRIDFWGQGNDLLTLPRGTARGYYRQDIASRGWAKFELETNPAYPDWAQAYAAGLLEGALTWQLIYWRWSNTIGAVCAGMEMECDAVREKLSKWADETYTLSKTKCDTEPFWHQIYLFFSQLQGIETGWNYSVKRNRQDIEITAVDFLWLQFLATDIPLPDKTTMIPHAPSLTSALLKLVVKPEGENTTVSEILAAQATAGSYRDMLQMVKRYVFHYHLTASEGAAPVTGSALTFTGYPGAFSSQDDIYSVRSHYLDGHSLLVTGSTIGNGLILTEGAKRVAEPQIPSSLRALAASRLARDGRTWTAYFANGRRGAGIAKQWTVLDLNKLDNPALDDANHYQGLLWIVEQYKGTLLSTDVSERFIAQSYWSTYGQPFHYEIRLQTDLTISDAAAADAPLDESPRAKLFAACSRNCSTKGELYELMRSAIRPTEDLVGARGDLYRNGAVPFGIIDTKIVSGSRDGAPQFEITSGPVYVTSNTTSLRIAPFAWSESLFASNTHKGQPDLWEFAAVQPEWIGY